MTTTPTTYELPAEPPIGTRVVDNRGISWKRDRGTPYGWDSLHMGGQCWNALLKDGPLTLIEPDPWPTAPLIVWTVNGDRGLFQRRALDEYVATTNGQVVEEGDGNTVSDPIPVTVVPTAEWEALREVLARWNTSFGTEHREVAQAANRLLAATDALEGDPCSYRVICGDRRIIDTPFEDEARESAEWATTAIGVPATILFRLAPENAWGVLDCHA